MRSRVKQSRRNEYVAMRNSFYSYITINLDQLPKEGSKEFTELFEAFKAGWMASRPSSRLSMMENARDRRA